MPDQQIDAIDLYWRRGCGYCFMLRHRLERSGVPLRKHDIWSDPAAAATVRGITGGPETVPTVVVGEVKMVNPSARQVMATVAEVAPNLVPPGG